MVHSNLPNWAEAVTAVVSVITMIAVLLGVLQIRYVNQQMHRELEMQYLERFWAVMDRRSLGLKLEEAGSTGDQVSREDQAVLREYLALCEDQIELRKLGRVTDHTWGYWREDIRNMCQSETLRAALAREGQDHYPHLRELAGGEQGSQYDPLEMVKLRRLMRGL